jgi:hypothetical protein
MPKFTQRPIEIKRQARKGGVSQEVIDEYKQYIEQLDKKNEGILEFKKDENINLGRKALVEAGVQLKRYIKVRKLRDSDNTLTFKRITKKEFDETKAKAAARGAVLKGKSRGKKKRSTK